MSHAGRAAKRSNPNAADSGSGTTDQPARHFIDFSVKAACQGVPGRGYRILDMKPGAFE